MKVSIAWGKLIIAGGAGSSPLLYYGLLSDSSLKPDRNVVLSSNIGGGEKELAKIEDGLRAFGDRFQGFLLQSACFNRKVTFEDVFELVFRLGEGRVKNIWRGYELDGVIGVRRKGLIFDWRNEGGSGYIKEDVWDTGVFGLIAYESESGAGLMLWAKGKPIGDEFKLNGAKEEVKGVEGLDSEIEGKKLKVRRSVKGIWGEKADNNGRVGAQEKKCKELEKFEETNKVIYKNYGMLQANGIPIKGIKILDWVHWGPKNVKNTDKMVLKQGQSNRGRYDYYELGEKITKVISGPLKEIRVSEEGINDGRGNQIKWSDKFKPTFTVKLEK